MHIIAHRSHPMKKIKSLKIILIKPSKYDDNGFVVRYFVGVLPSNTLACMRSLTLKFTEKWKNEKNINISIDSYDDIIIFADQKFDAGTGVGIESNFIGNFLEIGVENGQPGAQCYVRSDTAVGNIITGEVPIEIYIRQYKIRVTGGRYGSDRVGINIQIGHAEAKAQIDAPII